MKRAIWFLAVATMLRAEEVKPTPPVETTSEENAILYKIVAEVKLLQEYQKEVAQQLSEKQKEWDEEQAVIFARVGKKADEVQLQEDPKSKPRPHWVVAQIPPKPEPQKAAPPASGNR